MKNLGLGDRLMLAQAALRQGVQKMVEMFELFETGAYTFSFRWKGPCLRAIHLEVKGRQTSGLLDSSQKDENSMYNVSH